MIVAVALALFAGSYFPIIITAALALLAAGADYELLHNAVGIKHKGALAAAVIYSALAVFSLSEYTVKLKGGLSAFSVITVIYCIIAAVFTLAEHKTFDVKHITSLISMPIILSFAFCNLEAILNHKNGIYYLLLLLNFSSVCDMGAYFTGTAIGKHKLCPQISPKKTVEGAVGGVVASVAVSVILVFAFSFTGKLLVTLALTVPFCILGMVGDLFASAVKRAAGIKDYGKLIPGHGGILDRFDSIIMIAPLFYIFVAANVI